MNKKIFAPVFLIFAVLISSYAYAGSSLGSSGFDVSMDRVIVNGRVVADSRTNLIDDANVFSVLVDFTALKNLEKAHVEAILRGRQSSDVVSDFTGTFDLLQNRSSTAELTLNLADSLKRETQFDLTIKIVDVKGNSEQKTFGLKTRDVARGALDISIDRVIVNSDVVVPSRTNFIDKSNDFDVFVEFTALEDLTDAHIEAILKDLKSGTSVADASPNFDLSADTSSSKLLRLELLDKLKQSDSFELTIKVIDAEGNSIQQLYGLKMQRAAAAGTGRALDISIDRVEIENKVIAENENNFIALKDSVKELDLTVRLTSLEDVRDAHIDAVLSFENGDVVADATTTFDIGKLESASKRLGLPLIGGFEQNSFKLKVRVTDAENNVEEKMYGLKISQQEFPFVVSSILLEPEGNAEAGKSLLARIRFKNSGVVPLEGISAKVSIPELGVSSTKFIDQIKDSGLSEVREDFILKILDDTPTGTYTLRSEIASQFGGNAEVKELPVFVLGKDAQKKQIVNDKLVINVQIVNQDILNDGSEVIYPIILTNEGPDANTYTVLLDGLNWANLRLAEPNVFVIKPKESKTINIFASSKSGITGKNTFLVTVKGGDKVLSTIPLKGNIIASKATLAAKLKNILEIALIGIVILLAAIGLFFGIGRYFQGSEDSSEDIPDEIESYY